MKSKGLSSLVSIVVIAVGLLAATIAAGNKPLLGLDLKGGAEVAPPAGATARGSARIRWVMAVSPSSMRRISGDSVCASGRPSMASVR